MGLFDSLKHDADSPPVIAHPPVIYGVGFLVGYACNIWWGWSFGIGDAIALGWALIAGGFGLALWCFWYFLRAGTGIPTNKTTTKLVVTGPYRATRNPIYVALTCVYIGLASVLDAPALLLVLLIILPVMHSGVVLREEQYLTAKFGEPYEQYMRVTKRYL